MMRSTIQRHQRSFLVSLLAAGLLAGCGAPHVAEEEKAPPAPVKWENARLVMLEEWTELLGATQPLPNAVAQITAPIEGRVISVLRNADGKPLVEGQHVNQGDVIAQLDTRMLQANRDKTAAGQKVVQEELAQAQSALQSATIDVERLHSLSRRSTEGQMSLVSPVEVKKAELALEDAQSKVRATEARLESGVQEIRALDEQLKLFTLAAPRKGRLGRVRVVPGQTLSVGALVAEVVDLDDEVDVLCFVPPTVAGKLQIGQTARIGGLEQDVALHVNGDPEGRIEFIATQADPDTGNLAVKVRFPNKEAQLGSNMAVRVRVLTQPAKECLAIPESALMEDQEPPGVVVVEDVETKKGENGKEEQVGKARQLQAVIGVRDRTLHQVEVLRLEDKEKKWKGTLDQALFVVAKGNGLQTGDAVKLEEEDED